MEMQAERARLLGVRVSLTIPMKFLLAYRFETVGDALTTPAPKFSSNPTVVSTTASSCNSAEQARAQGP